MAADGGGQAEVGPVGVPLAAGVVGQGQGSGGRQWQAGGVQGEVFVGEGVGQRRQPVERGARRGQSGLQGLFEGLAAVEGGQGVQTGPDTLDGALFEPDGCW